MMQNLSELSDGELIATYEIEATRLDINAFLRVIYARIPYVRVDIILADLVKLDDVPLQESLKYKRLLNKEILRRLAKNKESEGEV